MSFRILSISYDPILLRVRHELLQRQGYAVTSAEGFVEALQLCKDGQFDLLIVGHSIPHLDKEALLSATRESCNAPVLEMMRQGEAPLKGATASVNPMEPQELLDQVERIAGRGKLGT